MQPDPNSCFWQRFDVLIVGGGAAGLYTSLSLPPELKIGLVTKDSLSRSASDWAQGGIAVALDSGDSPSLHGQDTLKAGAGLCEPSAVNFLVQQAPAQVQVLLEMGIDFDRRASQLAMTLEAAHSRPRVLHAADTTGKALIKTLTGQVYQRPNIHIFPETFTLDLWLNPQSQHCQGVCLMSQGEIDWVAASTVILATGGGGQVFAQTTNPDLSTGDGIAMAWRAGVQLRDLEFVQFHPTALVRPGAPRFLISEAVRGEGAHLINAQGHRFMFDYHPQGELAPRDVVSRAIFTHLRQTSDLAETQPPHVWLDLRPIPLDKIQRRFPKILQVCRRWGIDALQQQIPVAPAAHYWMGGIVTDLQAQSSIPGLYAVGEVASTGVHGANRLASNSLLECLVFAAQFSHLQPTERPVVSDSRADSQSTTSIPELTVALRDWEQQHSKISTIRQHLPSLVWHSAGICREGETMHQAIEQLQGWRQEFEQLPISQMVQNLVPGETIKVSLPDPDIQIRLWAETRNLLDIADLILKSAVFRTESRGGHYRSDYSEIDPHWQVHTLVQDKHWYKSAIMG